MIPAFSDQRLLAEHRASISKLQKSAIVFYLVQRLDKKGASRSQTYARIGRLLGLSRQTTKRLYEATETLFALMESAGVAPPVPDPDVLGTLLSRSRLGQSQGEV